jgi:hypothetical protein
MTKKNIYFIAGLFLLVGLAGCKDHVETIPGIDFDVTFKATYDGNQLEKNKDYVYGSFPLQILRYRLYLSDFTLLKNDGEEVRISEVEYLDFTPDSGASDLSVTPTITFKNVPEGMYDGIRLGFGVKPSLNAKQPADFPSGHPLNIETDYWAGWKSYIFMVLDGKADPDGDGIKNLPFSYHCGSDPVYETFTFNEHIHVAAGHGGIGVEFDVRKLFTNDNGSLYDIEANPATSNSVNDFRVAKDFMGNFDKATSIKQ